MLHSLTADKLLKGVRRGKLGQTLHEGGSGLIMASRRSWHRTLVCRRSDGRKPWWSDLRHAPSNRAIQSVRSEEHIQNSFHQKRISFQFQGAKMWQKSMESSVFCDTTGHSSLNLLRKCISRKESLLTRERRQELTNLKRRIKGVNGASSFRRSYWSRILDFITQRSLRKKKNKRGKFFCTLRLSTQIIMSQA